MSKIIKVKLSDLKKEFYVREKLKEDHWFLMAELMDAGVKFPPIEIFEDYRVQEGRHRIRAAEYLNLETIDAVIVPDKGELESVSDALEANFGGSLPPAREDIIHTLTYLIEKSIPRDKIIHQFSKFIPNQLINILYGKAASNISNKRVYAAIGLITNDGLDIHEAAKKVGLKSIAQIKNEIERRHGKGQPKIPNFKAIFASKFATFNNSNGHLITKLRQAYKEATISEETVADTLKTIGDLISNTTKIYEDWQSRFAKMK